jgi:hypothetical protein
MSVPTTAVLRPRSVIGDGAPTVTLGHRDRALLAAVDAGRCDLVRTGVPDVRVDGRWFCDQPRARALIAAGLVVAAAAAPGHRAVPALLTDAGRAALGCRGTAPPGGRAPRRP